MPPCPLPSEAKIRAKSLIRLSGYSIHTVSEDMETARRQRHADDIRVVGELIEMVSVDGRLLEGTEQAIAHLAGDLARSALKKHKCDACHSQLVCYTPAKVTAIELEQAETVAHSSETQMALRFFIELLNRGRLVFSSDTVLTVTKKVCRLYKEIVKNGKSKYALF